MAIYKRAVQQEANLYWLLDAYVMMGHGLCVCFCVEQLLESHFCQINADIHFKHKVYIGRHLLRSNRRQDDDELLCVQNVFFSLNKQFERMNLSNHHRLHAVCPFIIGYAISLAITFIKKKELNFLTSLEAYSD